VTFKDGATTLGTGTLDGSGQATFATSALALGSHSITAVYGGDSQFGSSTSAVLTQSVDVPADSVKLRALQLAVTKIGAQSSGQAISGAIDSAIAEGFSDGGQLITPSSNGLRLNFTDQKPANDPLANAFAAIAGSAAKTKANLSQFPKEWLAWADVRQTGWNTGSSTGDIGGGQVNALAGITHKPTSDLLIGVLGGYETFNYTSQSLSGRLKGDGWTAGAYLGWRFLPGLRLSAATARSSISYDGTAGTAAASFPGNRWLATMGLTGTYKTS